MEIKRIEAQPLNLEYKAPKAASQWVYKDIRNVLVVAETVDGLVGFGEGAPLAHFSGDTQAGVISQINDHIAPAVVGKDLFDNVRIHRDASRAVGDAKTAKAAVDMALFDLMGKALGVPVYQLLGGMVQESYTSCRGIGFGSVETMLKEIQGHIADGFTTFEVKMSEDVDEAYERIHAILTETPEDITYFFDPNEAWTASEAIRLGLRLTSLPRNFYFEQPIKKENLSGMAEIRRVTGVLISADEAVMGASSTLQIVNANAADIINIKLTKVGGFRGALDCIGVAEAAGVSYRVDTMVESKIGNSAHSHLAAATHQTLGAIDPHLNLVEDPVVSGGLVLEHGRVTPPSGPGLGITVNEKYLPSR